VQNVDKVQRELQRLRNAVKLWTMKAVTSIFGSTAGGGAQHTSVADLEKEAAALLSRPDVSEFVAAMNGTISEKSVSMPKTSRKVRLSMGAVLSPSPMKGSNKSYALYSPVRPIRSNLLTQMHKGGDELDVYSPPCSFPGVNGAYMQNGGRESILVAFPSLAAAAGSASVAAEPEETEKLLARMMDVSTSPPQFFA
jgi:urease gamma subunit